MSRKPTIAPPMTEAEMRQMRENGDSVSTIAQRARVRNGLSKPQVRQILFGESS